MLTEEGPHVILNRGSLTPVPLSIYATSRSELLAHFTKLRAGAGTPQTPNETDSLADLDSPLLAWRRNMITPEPRTSLEVENTPVLELDEVDDMDDLNVASHDDILSQYSPASADISPVLPPADIPDSPQVTDRPRAPTPSAQSPSQSYDEHTEFPFTFGRQSSTSGDRIGLHSACNMQRSASESFNLGHNAPSQDTHIRYPSSPSLAPSAPLRINLSEKSLSTGPPKHIVPSEATSTPPLPDLPDPNLFPDPYPFHSRYHATALSSAPSSGSASARSSYAFTSGSSVMRSSIASSHPSDEKRYPIDMEMARGDSDISNGLGMVSDDAKHLVRTSSMSSVSSGPLPRPLGSSDPNRWSSGSSSWGHRMSDGSGLRNQPSYEWNVVDERDELGLSTDDDTDADPDVADVEMERTAAIVVAEEGRGLIVNAEGMPISFLNVQLGTTHLLLASSATPNQVPSFLASTLPSLAPTLLALDISCNFLASLPVALASCEALEELNIASNPLRALPTFLSNLTCLRVLIADSTGCATLPAALATLRSLHTLSIRRNRLYSLPAWLCQLASLETLLVDGNPFQGPWKSLIDPLLVPQPLAYPPNTPYSTNPVTPSSVSSASNSPTSDVQFISGQADKTITLSPAPIPPNATQAIPRAPSPYLPRSTSSPSHTMSAFSPRLPAEPSRLRKRSGPPRPRTTISTASNVGANLFSLGSTFNPAHYPSDDDEDMTLQHQVHTLRKMKSADVLGRAGTSSPAHRMSDMAGPPPGSMKFTSLGPRSNNISAPSSSRSALPSAFYPSSQEHDEEVEDDDDIPLGLAQPQSHTGSRVFDDITDTDLSSKQGKWGFLKKMSISRMRSGSNPSKDFNSTLTRASTSYYGARGGRSTLGPQPPPIPSSILSPRPKVVHAASSPVVPHAPSGSMLGMRTPPVSVSLNVSPAPSPIPSPNHELRRQKSGEMLSSPSLLAPPAPLPTSRAGKRRSFLPLDTPSHLSIPLPPSPMYPNVSTPSTPNGFELEGQELVAPPHSPRPPTEDTERYREMHFKALRSVMAYLNDLWDLGISATGSGAVTPQETSPSPKASSTPADNRKRRGMPTPIDGTRATSEGSFASTYSTPSLALRNAPSTTSLGGAATSIATTDSNGSGTEERKYKDDKGKRAMIVKEIVETERTYVKGLQELVDIYVTPSGSTVSVLGSSIGKETIIPNAERKIVFNGLESLFSFHRESFLPSLEAAVAPLSIPGIDEDGQTSMAVSKAVAGVFLSHAAFMKMYSTYINNFDNSIQRLKAWTSTAPSGSTSPPHLASPQASTAHVVGLGISMSSVGVSGVSPDHLAAPAGLSSSQKKRIKTFTKRCRLNPRHSQLNLEGYLLLPVQRVPRYRLLLEELMRNTPPSADVSDDTLTRALAEITSLAENMNEGKRESESRRKLVLWQARIKGRFPSPLVQPHRRLIMDGVLNLTRVVRKTANFFEVVNASGENALIQVECLALETTPRKLVAVLCNDLLVLCKDPSHGRDPNSIVELWAVLRMQTVTQPASIVSANTLRLVDNKAILYFEADSTSQGLTWSRAINMNIPASK